MMTEHEFTYKRTKGVDSDHGNKFEWHTTALAYLKCEILHQRWKKDNKTGVKCFYVANNVAGIGAIDDVVVRVEYPDENEIKTKLILVQCKHLQDPTFREGRKYDMLLEKNIQKYFDSFVMLHRILNDEKEISGDRFDEIEKQSLKIVDSKTIELENQAKLRKILRNNFKCKISDCEILLYTNAEQDVPHIEYGERFDGKYTSSKDNMLSKDISSEIFQTSIKAKSLLNFTEKQLQNVRKEGFSEEELKYLKDTFRNTFRILFEQVEGIESETKTLVKYNSNVENVSLLLKQELQQIFGNKQCKAVSEKSHLFNNVENYYQLKFKAVIDQNNSSFTETLFSNDVIGKVMVQLRSRRVMKILTPVIKIEKHKLIQCFNVWNEGDKANSLLVFINDLSDFERLITARKTNTYQKLKKILVCFVGQSFRDFHNEHNEVIIELLLSTSDNESLEKYEIEFSSEAKQKVLDTNIIFQKRSVTVDKLCGKKWINFINEELLFEVLSKKDTVIENPPLPVLNCYLQRNLVIQTLTSQYLADLSVRINLPTLSKKYTFLLISERNENIPGFNDTKKWFENISEVGKVIRNMKLIGRDTFHFFIRHDENLELLYSFGETSHCGDVHILKDKEYIVSRNRKITFLSGDPGIGKTSTLHYLAQEYQKNNQSHWVFFIALKQYIHDLQDFDHDNSISKAVQFVAADLLKLKKLELLIFVKACNENGSVALFFDAFDALCPKAEKAFLSLILLLKETKISRIIVSSNTKHVRILEDEFLQHAITLVPLESHEKKCIILIKLQKIIEINNIEQKLRELEIEKVVSVILDSQDLDEFLNSILGIPLQLEIIEKYVFKEYILKEKLHCTNFESILFGFYDFLINYLPENFHANKIGEKVCSIQLSSDEIKIIAKDGNLLHITKKILLRKEYKNMRKVLDSILRQFNPVCRRAIADQRNIRCVKLKDNSRKGNTPQHVAASEENIEILKLLHLIDPNCLNEKNVLCQVPLHYACKKKREKSVNFLVYEANCLLNVVDDFGKSPIHYAIQNENLIILNCLLQHKTTQNSKENDECKTPLQFALEENKTEALKFLLNFGGYSFNVEDSNKSNPLHYASIIDYTKIAKRILSTDSTLLNKRNNDGATPLNLACKHDATHVVKYFLTNPECDFDTQDVAGNFPIHYASKNDNREIIEHILRGDQNMLNIRNSDGETPLSLTCVNYSFESAKCLLSYQNCLVSLGERTDIIHIATIKGNKDIIRLILEKDHTLLNKQNIDGQSPLHLACFHENIEAARCLLEYVDISVQIEDNMNRNSPIHYASMNGLIEIIELILMRDKTQINQQNGNGSTPLELACFSGKYQAVNFILFHPEFKPNLKVYDGNKLFRIAATSIYGPTIMRLLLGKFRIDPNMTNEENRTALHCAANSRNDEAIRFLLNHCKCSLSIRDTNGDTPLHIYIAAEGKGFYDKHNSTIELMKKKDPTILDIQNNVGYTPLDMAVLAKEIAICKHLIDFGANMEMIDWSQTSRSHK